MFRKTWIASAVISLVAFAPALAHAEVDKKVERLWKAKCASCHGADGKGKTEQGEKMAIADYTAADWQKGHTDAQIKSAITDGLKRDKGGKAQEMEGYKDKLTPEQVDQLVAFVRGLGK